MPVVEVRRMAQANGWKLRAGDKPVCSTRDSRGCSPCPSTPAAQKAIGSLLALLRVKSTYCF